MKTKLFVNSAIVVFAVSSCALLLRCAYLIKGNLLTAAYLMVGSIGILVSLINYFQSPNVPEINGGTLSQMRNLLAKMFFVIAFVSIAVLRIIEGR